MSLLLLCFLGTVLFSLFCSLESPLSTLRGRRGQVNHFEPHDRRGEEEWWRRGALCTARGIINITAAPFASPLPHLLKYLTKMNKAGQAPEPKAVFYLLRFPSHFLCRQSFDLRLVLDVLCAVGCQ